MEMSTVLNPIPLPTATPKPAAETAPVAPEPVTPTVEPEVGPAAPATPRAHGALRNLLAGRFHGVADLRMRINFHEDLSAMQAEVTGAAIEGNSLPPELSEPRGKGRAYERHLAIYEGLSEPAAAPVKGDEPDSAIRFESLDILA